MGSRVAVAKAGAAGSTSLLIAPVTRREGAGFFIGKVKPHNAVKLPATESGCSLCRQVYRPVVGAPPPNPAQQTPTQR
jgi:hypothetical protein